MALFSFRCSTRFSVHIWNGCLTGLHIIFLVMRTFKVCSVRDTQNDLPSDEPEWTCCTSPPQNLLMLEPEVCPFWLPPPTLPTPHLSTTTYNMHGNKYWFAFLMEKLLQEAELADSLLDDHGGQPRPHLPVLPLPSDRTRWQVLELGHSYSTGTPSMNKCWELS